MNHKKKGCMMDEHKKELLRNLPKIDEMMLLLEKGERFAGVPRELVKKACRLVVEELRTQIIRKEGAGTDLRLPTREAGPVCLGGPDAGILHGGQ